MVSQNTAVVVNGQIMRCYNLWSLLFETLSEICARMNTNDNDSQLDLTVEPFNSVKSRLKNRKMPKSSNFDKPSAPLSLAELPFKQRALVSSVSSDNAEVQCRLLTLGIYPGVSIEVLRRAPLGDPLQVRSGTTLLSIRQHEANGIKVQLA